MMFWPAKMCKVRVIGLRSGIRKAIDCLEKFGGAEIKRFSSHEMQNAKNFESHNEAVEKLLRLEALAGSLEGGQSSKKITEKEAAAYLGSKDFRQAEKRIGEANAELEGIGNEIESLKDLKSRLRLFSGFDADFSKMKAQTAGVAAGLVSGRNRQAVIEALEKAPGLKFVEKSASKTSSMVLVAYPKSMEGALEELSKAGFERVTIPEMGSTPSAEMVKAEKRILELTERKKAISKGLCGVSSREYGKIGAARESLGGEVAKSNAAAMLGSTEHTFVLEAYLPERNFHEFEKIVGENFGKKIEVRKFSSKELEAGHEQAPTLLEHSKALAPFEFMTKYVSVPRSNELDPTLVFLFFFPIFYGMMVGDFIYGIVSFLIARAIMKRVPEQSILKPVSIIWMWGAIPTIIFGLIFDEFAGFSHERIAEVFFGLHNFSLYHGLERLHNVQFLLTATILFGLLTVCTGFLLGFLNATKHGDKKHALAKIGWFGIVASGSVLVSTVMFNAFPQAFALPAGVAMGISLLAMLKAEGPMGLIEIPSVMGNVLSFARILAVGLVGTVIAFILNELAFPSLDKGFLIILLLPLYICGHLFNAFLAMFESFIQGARLNFVEFYSKFYEGGGKEFAPFKLEKKYLRE